MNKILLTIIALGGIQLGIAQPSYVREWATYFGDSGLSIASSTEFRGNLYLAGKAKNSSFIGTIINEDNHQYSSGAGNWDGFLAKISPQGQVLWFTYYGGAGDDEIIDLSADDSAVYVVGKTKSSGMGSANVHQTSLSGTADGFIASFDDTGNRNWHTYFGGENEDEVISLAQNENGIYLYGRTLSKTNIATSGSFQESITANGDVEGDYLNYFIAEFDKTGQRIWSTYYGIATNNTTILGLGPTPLTSISVNETGLYISGWDTGSYSPSNTTYFGTAAAFLTIRPTLVTGFGMSLFLSKFSFEGTRLWSTYFSAYSSNGTPTSITPNEGGGNVKSYRSLTATSNGVYLAGRTLGIGIATTEVFQPEKTTGGTNFIVNFSDVGERVWCSYLGNFSSNNAGGNYAGTNLIGLNHDTEGNIYISGATHTLSDVATTDGYQVTKNAFIDCFTAKISADGTNKVYGTYYGGSDSDSDGRAVPVGNGTSFYIVGSTASYEGMATDDAWQKYFIPGGEETKNIFITKFTLEEDLSLQDISKSKFVIYPNPSSGNFIVSFENPLADANIQIFDMQGRIVHAQKATQSKTVISVSNLSKGMYLLNVISENKIMFTDKIIIEN